LEIFKKSASRGKILVDDVSVQSVSLVYKMINVRIRVNLTNWTDELHFNIFLTAHILMLPVHVNKELSAFPFPMHRPPVVVTK
jgi:hypothetical protein